MELQLLIQFYYVAFERFYCSYQTLNAGSMLSNSLRRWPHIETLLDTGLCILID